MAKLNGSAKWGVIFLMFAGIFGTIFMTAGRAKEKILRNTKDISENRRSNKILADKFEKVILKITNDLGEIKGALGIRSGGSQ